MQDESSTPDPDPRGREGESAAFCGLTRGMLLGNRYLIDSEIGRGAFGIVYLASDRQLNSRRVVIKVLRDRTLQDGRSIDRFRQEIEALARVDHPSIVGILDAGEMTDGWPYIVMQYVEGKSLRSVLTATGMPLERAADLIRQMGHALSAAHEKGILHRDLKPENIMLRVLGGGEELLMVIDFGVAKLKDSLAEVGTSDNRVVGTVFYMAPEQLEKGPVTAASDIYALGVIAYEMVTGRQPFNPESGFQLLEMQRAGVRVRPKDLRPSLPQEAEAEILRALSCEPGKRHRRARDFGDAVARALAGAGAGDAHPSEAPTIERPSAHRAQPTPGEAAFHRHDAAKVGMHVALLYRRGVHPDEYVLNLLEADLLARGHEVFVDRHLSVGLGWAQEVERQLRTADAVVPLLSAASVESEMLTCEIQTAYYAAQEQDGRPRLLPVFVRYEESLPSMLASVLDPRHCVHWRGPQDDRSVAEEVLASLSAPSDRRMDVRRLEPVGGAVPLDSKFYIVRPTDDEFLAAIERRDSVVLVKGARQMGKTSLLARGLRQARELGARVVLTDFQSLNEAHFASADSFYLTLGELIADHLDLDVLPQEVWKAGSGPSVNFQRYMRREVLGKVNGPLIWGLDEVDRLFTCPFGSEVFALFRSWHNARALNPDGPWNNLTMAIAYATEARLFISDLNQSPFNVGTRLSLEDFTLEQMMELNQRYGSPLRGGAEVDSFYGLVSGHPYLVHGGLRELTVHGKSLDAFAQQADHDEGPFGEHLRRFLMLLVKDKALCDVMREILRGHTCPSIDSFYRLRSAGLLIGDSYQEAKPRCQIYANYLSRHLL